MPIPSYSNVRRVENDTNERIPSTTSAGPECKYKRVVKGPPKPGYNYTNPFNGRTLLTLAAEHGHERVVKMLLERRDVDPNRADTKYGRTPLAWAAGHGYERVVKMLLERRDVNPNQVDTKYGQTPLSLAARGGHEGIVKMLLQRGDVNPNQGDTGTGRAPLSWAAECGNEGVVKLLLERKDGRALPLALSNGDDSAARTVQEWAYPRPNGADHSNLASHQPSTQHEDECVVEIQPRGDGPNTEIRGLNAQRTPPSADLDERDLVLDEDSIPKPLAGGLSSTKASRPPKSPSVWCLKFRRLRMKIRTRLDHP